MQVSKWGNSLAVRIPAPVARSLDLKEGDEIEIRAADQQTFELARTPDAEEVLARIRRHRGRLPAGFHFAREEAHERG